MADTPISASTPADQRAAVLAGFLGWTLDAFDFFLVVMTLTAIGKEFGKSDAAIALSLTLTLLFRPVGAFVFGLLADRYGRKLPLMIDLVFYSVVEVLTGLAPSYATFLVLRALFGVGMGAESGVGASLVMEKVPARYRGVVSGLLQQGYALGYLLAAVCYLVVFPRWGWRPLFFIGGLPALLALFVRARVRESDVWRETRHDNWSGLGGVIPAHLNELSPDAVRGFLPGFAYQCGVAIASQIPHVQALFATGTSYAQAMALSAATVFILGAVAAGLGPERRGVAFGRGAP